MFSAKRIVTAVAASIALCCAPLAAHAATTPTTSVAASVPGSSSGQALGIDVSGWQVLTASDWNAIAQGGISFAYIKATEGTSYVSSQFTEQYTDSYNAGLIRGAYHYAIPSTQSGMSGAAQAQYFVAHGGGWSPDGRTLPPMLDIENNTDASNGNSCYNLNPTQMVSWINDFSQTVLLLTGRLPVIYSNAPWWNLCTGNSTAFSANPLFIASWTGSPSGSPTLPSGWNSYTFWQYADSGPFPGDADVFNGSVADLQAFASRPDAATYFQSYYLNNSSWLGAPTGTMVCGSPDGGCYQAFQGGMVFSSTHSYASGVRNNFLPTWGNYGREFGPLGYPVADQVCSGSSALSNGQCYQQFQGGYILQTSSGYRVVFNSYWSTWGNWGREYGALGYPTADQSCSGSICSQQFQNGWLVNNGTTGMHIVMNSVMTTWQNWGREYGILGFPTGDPSVPGGSNYTQTFQGGTITVTGGNAAVTSATDPWFNTILTQTWLGSSTGSQTCDLNNGACRQLFTNGWVVKSPAGSYAVPSGVVSLWANWGREYGILGFPTGNPSANPTTGNYTQTFQGGTITVTGGNAAVLTNPNNN